MTTFRPLRDRVLIAPTPRPTETASGLILAEEWRPELTGTVLAVGPLVTEIHPADAVIFSWMAGQEVRDHDSETRYLLLSEKDVMAVME